MLQICKTINDFRSLRRRRWSPRAPRPSPSPTGCFRRPDRTPPPRSPRLSPLLGGPQSHPAIQKLPRTLRADPPESVEIVPHNLPNHFFTPFRTLLKNIKEEWLCDT